MTTKFIDHLLEGDHASRPAFGDVPEGTLYACSDHGLIYQSDGTSAWSTWATLGGTESLPESIIAAKGDLIVGDGNDSAAILTAGTNGHRLVADSAEATGLKWSAAGAATITVEEDGDTPVTGVDTIVFDGATVTDDTGGQVTISGFSGGAAAKYSPDGDPGTISFEDDFAGSSLGGGWAWTDTPGVINDASLDSFYRWKGTNTGRWLSHAWTPGANDITAVCKVFAAYGARDSFGGLYVADATGGSASGIGILWNTSNGGFAGLKFFTASSGTWSSQVGSTLLTPIPAAQDFPIPLYLRFTRLNSGPTWTGSISVDGLTWRDFSATSNLSLTVGAIGFYTETSDYWALDFVRGFTSVTSAIGG